MRYFLIIAEFSGGPFTFVFRTPNDSSLDKKVTAVVYERYQAASFAPGPITFKETVITEEEFNASPADIKWDSNELELKTAEYVSHS